MGKAVFIVLVLVGGLLYNVDARAAELEKRKNWNFGFTPSINNGLPGIKGNLKYDNNGFSAGGAYTFQKTPGDDFHKMAGNIAYKNDNFGVGIQPSITNGLPGFKADIGAEKNGSSVGGGYEYQKSPFNDYHKAGLNIEFEKNNLKIKGAGFYDSTGDWGADIGLEYSFKRSLHRV